MFVAHLAWALRLVFGETPLTDGGAALVAADLLLLGLVALLAVVLAPTPWSRRIALAGGAVLGLVAVAHPIDAGWIVATVAGGAFVLLLAPTPDGSWFVSPPRSPVPARASALAIGLAAFPAVIGAGGFPSVTPIGYLVAAASIMTGWAYARALLPALWFARFGWPPLALAATIGLQPLAAAAVALAVAPVAWLAWSKDARVAASPLVRTTAAVQVLPELVPPEILEAAGFDHKGRPKERS
jgi:hypothetical protein